MADVRILKVRVGLKTNQGPEVAYGNKYDLLYIYIYICIMFIVNIFVEFKKQTWRHCEIFP